MQFNSDPNKQANGVIFSRKLNSSNLTYPLLNLTVSALLTETSKTFRNCFRFKAQL